MSKEFKEIIGKQTEKTTEHKLYLQVQLSSGFWDTIHWETEYEFNKNDTIFDNEISRLLEQGFKVRILSIVVKQQETITEFVKEI